VENKLSIQVPPVLIRVQVPLQLTGLSSTLMAYCVGVELLPAFHAKVSVVRPQEVVPTGVWPVTRGGKGQIVGVGVLAGRIVGVAVGRGVDVGYGVGVGDGWIIIGPGGAVVAVGNTGFATQFPPSQHCDTPQSQAQVTTFKQLFCTQLSPQAVGNCVQVPPDARQPCWSGDIISVGVGTPGVIAGLGEIFFV
jgi:hypothetical protein